MLLTSQCSICSELRVIEDPISPQPFPRPDCDLRSWNGSSYLWPAPVFACHACGAAGTSLGGLGPVARAWVASAEYRALMEGLPPRYGVEFAAGMLEEAAGRHGGAFERYLAASWIADAASESGSADLVWRGLSDRARRAAVDAWIAECGDIFDPGVDVPRTYEEARGTVVGDVLLDNLVLVDLLRRLGEWDHADHALAVSLGALLSSVADLGERAGWGQDAELIVDAVTAALELQGAMIRHRQQERAGAALDLPLWWAE